MRKLLIAGLLASASMMAAPASAAEYIFDDDGDSFEIDFDGFGGDPEAVIPGLSANLIITLLSGVGSDTFTFEYTVTNTSTSGGPDSRVSGFAFDMDPQATSGSAMGAYDNLNLVGTYPVGGIGVDACLSNNNGNGCSGQGGALLGSAATGTFTLGFDESLDSLTLGDFYVRYQSLNGVGTGSAIGREVPAVPEPGTWALLLLGFGFVGAAMRRPRQRQEVRVRYS
ncbi:cistern family PEP-CTERM protein [Altererythrobacter aurantiacus]|uniref:Cistern family PEP-CTERM protein n=1 Tax=Parapontixanthobacter aurantiacus TaxID=1463599 RepID=A0A844ZEX0_9SPHN|nr:cistern family PEP-CTERM protein [Parapontixanthobacter aurantiacus]MXO86425.1 cistern family PEP-CTERM protein [Parapontixanthobacter aurantiacus]